MQPWQPPGWGEPPAAEPWHPSHRLDAWHQYGFVLDGDGPGLVVDVTQRCERCQMAVRVGDAVTPVGVQACIGAPPGRRPA